MFESIYRDFEDYFLIDFNRIKWDFAKINPEERASLLIVEDESSFREMLKEFFTMQEMYKIETAQNGQEGLDKYLRSRHDVILTDVMMDALTGIEMAEKIIQINPHQKIFFVSAWSSKKMMFDIFEKQFMEGYFQFIDKPFDLKDFQNRVFLFMNDKLSGIVFHVLDKKALERTVAQLEPYQILVLHGEILNRCIYLARELLGREYTRESISSYFLKDKDYMKRVNCKFDEVYCRGNFCIKIAPECMVQKLKKQIEIIVDLIEEIYDFYKRFELRKRL
ncbi:MAG: response regulator [Candidatus Delongbacteria bacterium]|jgi:CheY-like chemotaxis protein|nr:response regulator [Candidatus Delongbacteria bacterium]MDY0016887.1 response regulator [Candidatus Delongbacteria bacterium]